jgi:hypothetical protein
LAAELNDNTIGLFNIDYVHHIFESQWLKIQAVRCVVIGRHCLWIAVDHYGLKTGIAQSKRGVAAAVVEFNALADTIRA